MHKEIKLYDASDVIEFSLCNVQVSVNFTVFIGKSTISRPFQVLDMTCSIQVEHCFLEDYSWAKLPMMKDALNPDHLSKFIN